MSNEQIAVTITLLNKDYKFGCSANEQKLLESSAKMLDQQMQKVRDMGVLGTEKIAVLAALNITKELLQLKQAYSDNHHLSQDLDQLTERLSNSLNKLKQ